MQIEAYSIRKTNSKFRSRSIDLSCTITGQLGFLSSILQIISAFEYTNINVHRLMRGEQGVASPF